MYGMDGMDRLLLRVHDVHYVHLVHKIQARRLPGARPEGVTAARVSPAARAP